MPLEFATYWFWIPALAVVSLVAMNIGLFY